MKEATVSEVNSRYLLLQSPPPIPFHYSRLPSLFEHVKMGRCASEPTFSHDNLPIGRDCPWCGQKTPPTPTSSTSTVSTAPTAVPVVTASPFLSTARKAINAAKASRATAIAVAASTIPPPVNPDKPKNITFHVRVAHCTYKLPTDPAPTVWMLWPGSWLCSFAKGTPLAEWDLEGHLSAGSDRLLMDYTIEMMHPTGGSWQLAINHLSLKKTVPIHLPNWQGLKNIEDIIHDVGYTGRESQIHPISLIWYQSRPINEPETPATTILETITPADSVSNVATAIPISTPLPATALPIRKRKVSTAIPQKERANDRHDVITQEVRDDETERGNADGGQRRSGRARKATMKAANAANK